MRCPVNGDADKNPLAKPSSSISAVVPFRLTAPRHHVLEYLTDLRIEHLLQVRVHSSLSFHQHVAREDIFAFHTYLTLYCSSVGHTACHRLSPARRSNTT